MSGRSSWPRATPPPTRVGDRYRVDELIARGGMAAVYRGHDEQLGRPVAVKVMRAELGDDPRFVRRFEAEARRAASVTHPNLVAIYDVGTHDGTPYIVMELVDGGDLAAALRHGPVAPERAARIGADVAAALEAAHATGLIHRDVKPGNILLGTDGRARVADFGIARATGEESLTRTGALLGSVEYFSPEQARGERATAASDVYGLGAVLYELLTGSRPFRGDSPYAVATARLRQPVPDPRDVEAGVPAELAAIVRRAMAVDPRSRYASAAELRRALERWLSRATVDRAAPGPGSAATAELAGAAPAGAEPGGAAAGAKRSDRRRDATAWAVVVAVVLLAAAGYVGARLLAGEVEPGGIANPIPIIVGTPGGEARSPTPSAEPTERPDPTDRPRTPTPAPATPSATPAPETTATPAVVARADAPDDAVAAFYAAVVDGRFDDAYALWSDRMKATYPRRENLDDRFDGTASISFSQLAVAGQSADGATVQANFTETYDSGSSREFIGYWRLVRVNGAWLLDEPNY